MELARQEGKVVLWSHIRNFGFIRPDEGGDDVFFHGTELPAGHCPASGERVSFVLGSAANRRVSARNVTPIDGDVPEAERQKGRIANYDPNRGYGFITATDGESLFYHVNDVDPAYRRHIQADDAVSFVPGDAQPGPQNRARLRRAAYKIVPIRFSGFTGASAAVEQGS